MTERDRAEELAKRMSKSLKSRASIGDPGADAGESSHVGSTAIPLVGTSEDGNTVHVALENGDGEVCVRVCVFCCNITLALLFRPAIDFPRSVYCLTQGRSGSVCVATWRTPVGGLEEVYPSYGGHAC